MMQWLEWVYFILFENIYLYNKMKILSQMNGRWLALNRCRELPLNRMPVLFVYTKPKIHRKDRKDK